MENTSRRDLARLGTQLGEQDSELFKTTLHSLGSPQSKDVGTEESIDHVAAQVYEAAPDGDVDVAEKYVRTFLAVYELSSLSDVNDLLGRESHERENYTGQKAFV